MYCTQCGAQLPQHARFCPACGSPVDDEARAAAHEPAGHDSTTAAIDVGVFDTHSELSEVPDLAPGTGMLVVIRGPNAGSRFLLDRDVTTIGRHPDSHIFLDDVTVSRRHTEVQRGNGGMTAVDLGSLNGTYINGERVEERRLASGDELQIGRFKLLYVGAGAA